MLPPQLHHQSPHPSLRSLSSHLRFPVAGYIHSFQRLIHSFLVVETSFFASEVPEVRSLFETRLPSSSFFDAGIPRHLFVSRSRSDSFKHLRNGQGIHRSSRRGRDAGDLCGRTAHHSRGRSPADPGHRRHLHHQVAAQGLVRPPLPPPSKDRVAQTTR